MVVGRKKKKSTSTIVVHNWGSVCKLSIHLNFVTTLGSIILYAHFRDEKTEKLGNFPKVIQILSRQAGFWAKAIWNQSLGS